MRADFVICVPSNPCMTEECKRHVANCDEHDTRIGMADLSNGCEDYEPLMPDQVGMPNAYTVSEQ